MYNAFSLTSKVPIIYSPNESLKFLLRFKVVPKPLTMSFISCVNYNYVCVLPIYDDKHSHSKQEKHEDNKEIPDQNKERTTVKEFKSKNIVLLITEG